MTDNTRKLLDLIRRGKSANEIASEMNISNKQLFNYLATIRNIGFDFYRKYYDTGDIVYVPKKSVAQSEYPGTSIITDRKSSSYTAMVISDLHFGSGFEIIGIMDRIYDYCVKFNIHNIICCGDLIDGTFNKEPQRISDPYQQVDYFIKKYPFDKNILTFTVLGDHDYSVMAQTGQDFSMVLDSYRHDIVPLGYGMGFLNIKKSVVTVKHYIGGFSSSQQEKGLVLKGHSHISKLNCFSNLSCIDVPSLSNLNFKQGDPNSSDGIPSVYVMKLEFRDDNIRQVSFRQIMILADRMSAVNEICYAFYGSPDIDFGNIEDYTATQRRDRFQIARDRILKKELN